MQNIFSKDSEISNEQKLMFESLTWSTEDYINTSKNINIIGVISLNTLTQELFSKELYRCLPCIIKKVKINNNKVYWKHDINNGVLTSLQLNSKLKPEFYEYINLLRDKLWINDSEYIDDNELKKMFDA